MAKYTRSHKVFDEYLLYSDPTTTTEDMHDKIPKRGVRLDDLAMALVLKNVTSPKELNQWWPAEFDTKGMPRATRIPLGHAAKMWVSAGDVDIDGNVATAKDEGWYYKWWKGLQVLMGKEGYDAWLYKIRPSWEKDKCGQFGFKLTHKAIFQHESGYTSACEKSGKTDGNPKGNARTNNSGPNKAAKRKVYSAGAGQRKRQKTTVQGVVRHNGRTPSFPRGTSTAVILHFYFGPFEHWY